MISTRYDYTASIVLPALQDTFISFSLSLTSRTLLTSRTFTNDQVSAFYGFTEQLPAEALFIREEYLGSEGQGGVKAVLSKSIYYFPPPARALLQSDADNMIKVQC